MTNSTVSGGQVTNANFEQVFVPFDATATNRYGVHFKNSGGTRKHSVAPDANGIPSLWDTSASVYTMTPSTFTPSGANLLSYASATNAFGALATPNTWTKINQFTSISNSTITASMVTNTVGYLTNLFMSYTAGSAGPAFFVNNDSMFHTYGSTDSSHLNLFFGPLAGNDTLTGKNNYCFGNNSGHSLTSGSANMAYGMLALQNLTSGISNSGFGYGAMSAATTGSANAGFGWGSLSSITTGGANTGVGVGAGPSSNQTNTVALGYNATPVASGQGYLGANTYTTPGARQPVKALRTAFGSEALTSHTLAVLTLETQPRLIPCLKASRSKPTRLFRPVTQW